MKLLVACLVTFPIFNLPTTAAELAKILPSDDDAPTIVREVIPLPEASVLRVDGVNIEISIHKSQLPYIVLTGKYRGKQSASIEFNINPDVMHIQFQLPDENQTFEFEATFNKQAESIIQDDSIDLSEESFIMIDRSTRQTTKPILTVQLYVPEGYFKSIVLSGASCENFLQ